MQKASPTCRAQIPPTAPQDTGNICNNFACRIKDDHIIANKSFSSCLNSLLKEIRCFNRKLSSLEKRQNSAISGLFNASLSSNNDKGFFGVGNTRIISKLPEIVKGRSCQWI